MISFLLVYNPDPIRDPGVRFNSVCIQIFRSSFNMLHFRNRSPRTSVYFENDGSAFSYLSHRG